MTRLRRLVWRNRGIARTPMSLREDEIVRDSKKMENSHGDEKRIRSNRKKDTPLEKVGEYRILYMVY